MIVRSESVCSVIALTSKNGLKLHQMHITTAFLSGDLDEEELVCRLRKSIYGLKQSPRCWNQALDAQLKLMGFMQSTSDPCIYTSTTELNGLFIFAVYVDDILLAEKSQQKIAQVKADLRKRFQLKNMGEIHYFLGVSVMQRPEEIWIGQPAYTRAVIKKFGMEHCKPANTLVTPGAKLLKATEQSEIVDATLYQSAVSSLLYLSSGWTRPNIAFAVSNVARFCSSPTKEHWTAVKRILRYIKGTSNYGVAYSRSDDADGVLIGYSDADWAADVNDRKSTCGHLFMVGGAAVS